MAAYTLTEARYDCVLGFINRLRAEHKIGRPLKRIPRGVKRDSQNCPVATALTGGRVKQASVCNNYCLLELGGGASVRVTNPNYVADFINAFDEGKCTRLRKLAKGGN